MQRYTQNWQLSYPLLFVLALVLFCSACGPAQSTTRKTSSTPVPINPNQPVSGQQIQTDPVVYIALGASDAVGVGTDQPGSEGYVPLVAAHLPQGSHLLNLGISGIHLHEAMTQELPLALSTSPQLITIWLVANDFVAGVPYDRYMEDLNSTLKQLRAGTKARIVMANLPDLTLLPALARSSTDQKIHSRAEILRWNARIATISAQYHVALVDLFGQHSQLTSHPEYISGDGFHPSPAGYVQLADLFWLAIDNTQ